MARGIVAIGCAVAVAGSLRCAAEAPTDAQDPALLAHYTFEDDAGDTAPDCSGYGHDARLEGTEYVAELAGRQGVLHFDGTDAVLNLPDTPALRFGGDMTFEMRMRQHGQCEGTWATLFGNKSSFAFYVAYWHTLVLWYGAVDPVHGRESMVVPVDRGLLGDAWSHIAVVVEYPRCRFYHNGELVRDAYMPIPGVTKLTGPLKVGMNSPIDLDEFRLYRRALAPTEIAAHAAGVEAEREPYAELTVEPHWYEDAVALRLAVKGRDCDGFEAELGLVAADGTAAVAPRTAPLAESSEGSGRFVATATFELGELTGRALDGVAHLRDRDGALVQRVFRHAFLEKPAWVHSREGHSDTVLPPWTPLVVEAEPPAPLTVEVWGRRHVFGDGPFPRQIVSDGAELLAEPIALRSRTDGSDTAWAAPRTDLVEAGETVAVLRTTQTSPNLTLRVDTRIEYDGYMRFDCDIGVRAATSVEQLALEVPLHTRHAGLCFGDRVLPPKRGIAIAEWYSGAVTDDLDFRFSGCIWLGDASRGLCWQAESDRAWRNADGQRAITIRRDGDTTTFRANFIDVPTRLEAGTTLRYTFALVATPIKPRLRDAWDLRIVRSEPYGADLELPDRETNGVPTLQFCAQQGMRRLFVNVNDRWPYPLPSHPEFSRRLHRLIDTAHSYGMKLHPYLIHQRVPTMIAEFDPHGLHMAKRPVHQYIPGANPPGSARPGPITATYGANSQGTVFMCPQSQALQDAYVHSLARRLDEYGDDGVYLDGTVALVPCHNFLHGCGYRGEDGAVRPTYPVFAVREFMRRIYTVVKTRDPDAVVDVHASFGPNFPALAYADMLWTGEQWHHLRGKGAEHIAAELTLDQFRTEFTGRQSGVAAETLAYRLGARMKVAATSLLHDVPVRPNNTGLDQLLTDAASTERSYTEVIIRLWRLRERFGAADAEKLFYWRNGEFVRAEPEGCYVTLFRHPVNGVLAFVTNLSRAEQTVAVTLDLARLGLAGRDVTVIDAMTEAPLDMDRNGRLALPLGSEEWTYVWLRPARGD